jgi:hypothetical protein
MPSRSEPILTTEEMLEENLPIGKKAAKANIGAMWQLIPALKPSVFVNEFGADGQRLAFDFVPRGEAGRFIAERNTAPASPGRPAGPAARGSRSTPMAAASPTCIPACTACTRCRRAFARCAAPPRPNPRRQDLGLLRRRRHVRRLGDDYHVEQGAVGRGA